MVGRLKSQVLRNQRVIKYGIVGVVGIMINLAAMAGLLHFFPPQSWVPSALANVLSTVINFLLHNMWTFSDRRHQGASMIRGFVLYVLACGVGIFLTTVCYVQFIRLASHLAIANTHLGKTFTPLVCQCAAIFLGAAINYVFNKQFTWPQSQENQPAASAQTGEAQPREAQTGEAPTGEALSGARR